MATEKKYIGYGKQKAGSEYIRLTLCMEDLLQADISEREGKHYLKVVVARRRSTSRYGNTHTAYVPPVLDEDEKRFLQHSLVADQQEMEYHNRED